MKFAPQIHLFLCLAMLGNMSAPVIVRADPPHAYAAERRPVQTAPASRVSSLCSRINTPTAMVDEKERKQNRELILSNIKKTLTERAPLHRQNSNGAQQPNTVGGVGAQTVYYDYLAHTITTVCETQRKIHEFFVQYQQQITFSSQATDKRDEAICGSFQETEKLYATSSKQIGDFNTAQEKVLAELKKVYRQEADKNKQSVLQFTERPADLEKLKNEFGKVWGASFFNRTEKTRQLEGDGSFPVEKTAIFGNVMYRLEQNKEDSKDVVAKMDNARNRMAASYARCGGYVPGQPVVTADTASEQSDISGPSEEVPSAVDPNATVATDDTTLQDPPINTTTQNDPEAIVDGRKYVNPYDPEKKEPIVEPPPLKEVKEEGWISRNKGMLLTVGAGAAAVGGLLWYKKSQDKKAEENAAALEAEARALASTNSSSTSTVTVGSTSTSTNTDSTFGGTPANAATPQGSKLVLSGIPSGSVAVNTTIPTITVAVINPSGILTQDSHSEIIVSCIEPAGCTLSGTGQAQTSAGKAKFSELRFTSPHENVKLMFTSPGFDSVTSVYFSVIGSGETSTSTSTTTSTSTDTGGGNRE